MVLLASRHISSRIFRQSHSTIAGCVRVLRQQRLVAMAATAGAAGGAATVQQPSRPKVAVGQMTAVGDQLTNFNTCSKLAQVGDVHR